MKTVFPAEWAPQDAVMLTWPHQDTDWASILMSVEMTYLAIAKEILTEQSLVIVAHNQQVKERIIALFIKHDLNTERVHFVVCETNDTWARDHGPICVYQDDVLTALDFTFNGWGSKHQSDLDNQINSHLFKTVLAPHATSREVELILEGGGIETDGQGTLLTTKECLLNKNRNTTLSQQALESTLEKELGIHHFLWLEHGFLAGDDTDSHIDTLARFAPNNGIVYVSCEDNSDEHYSELSKMESQLKEFQTKEGDNLVLFPLPWPQAKFDESGERLPATYANYLIINNKVLVPTYQDKNDEKALNIIAAAYPEHQIIGIDCLYLIQQFGSLHCITMQLPRGFLRN